MLSAKINYNAEKQEKTVEISCNGTAKELSEDVLLLISSIANQLDEESGIIFRYVIAGAITDDELEEVAKRAREAVERHMRKQKKGKKHGSVDKQS